MINGMDEEQLLRVAIRVWEFRFIHNTKPSIDYLIRIKEEFCYKHGHERLKEMVDEVELQCTLELSNLVGKKKYYWQQ